MSAPHLKKVGLWSCLPLCCTTSSFKNTFCRALMHFGMEYSTSCNCESEMFPSLCSTLHFVVQQLRWVTSWGCRQTSLAGHITKLLPINLIKCSPFSFFFFQHFTTSPAFCCHYPNFLVCCCYQIPNGHKIFSKQQNLLCCLCDIFS